ncbi:MAG: tetratricopeptide repeat protein [Chloroflexi bacterium]|nr:tetratricopeptide repeat protein [Chloroflexota bacterium]
MQSSGVVPSGTIHLMQIYTPITPSRQRPTRISGRKVKYSLAGIINKHHVFCRCYIRKALGFQISKQPGGRIGGKLKSVQMEQKLEDAHQLLERNKINKAIEMYQSIIQTDPGDALAHQGLAQCFHKLGHGDSAITEAHKALAINPELAIAHMILSSQYLQQGKFKESEHEARKAVEIDSQLADGYVALGNSLMMRKQLEEAIVTLRHAVQLAPNSWVAHYNLGLAYWQFSLAKEAFSEMKIAFKCHPSFRTGIMMVLIYERAMYPWFTSLLLGVASLVLFWRSILSLLMTIIVLGYFLTTGMIGIQAGQKRRGFIRIMSTLLFVVLFFLNPSSDKTLLHNPTPCPAVQSGVGNELLTINCYSWETQTPTYHFSFSPIEVRVVEWHQLVVDVTIRNQLAQELILDCEVWDANGNIYVNGPPFYTLPNESLSIIHLQPGETQRGKLGFSMPLGFSMKDTKQKFWLRCEGLQSFGNELGNQIVLIIEIK